MTGSCLNPSAGSARHPADGGAKPAPSAAMNQLPINDFFVPSFTEPMCSEGQFFVQISERKLVAV